MKRILIIIFCVGFALPAFSQLKASGGFGYFVAGVSGTANTKIQTRLQSATLLGNGFSFNTPGLHFGGRGYGVFGKFLMGGGGYGSSFSGTTNAGEAKLSVGGGFFNVGYFIVQKPTTYLYAFGGFGGGGGSLKVINNSQLTMSFDQNQNVPSGENRKISQGGFGFELGVGFNKMVIGSISESGGSGFMVGLIAGINFFPSDDWEFEATKTNVTNMGNMSSFYIGLTIGGGSLNK